MEGGTLGGGVTEGWHTGEESPVHGKAVVTRLRVFQVVLRRFCNDERADWQSETDLAWQESLTWGLLPSVSEETCLRREDSLPGGSASSGSELVANTLRARTARQGWPKKDLDFGR